MKRKLLKQTRNEWRANLWLAIELLLVSVIVWFITDYIYSYALTVSEPNGFDITNTYALSVSRSGSASPYFVDYGEEAEQKNADDAAKLYDALRTNPDIAAVSTSYNADPYVLNYYGQGWYRVPDSLRIGVRYMAATPSHLDVFEWEPAVPGVTREQLKQALRSGKALITDFPAGHRAVGDSTTNAAQLVGSQINSWDGESQVEIGGVIRYLKRRDTEPAMLDIGLITWLDDNNPSILAEARTYSIRVKADRAKDFVSRFNADRTNYYRFGNTYISDIKPYSTMERTINHDTAVFTRKFVACMLFLLVSVFLGLLGTFWFRTRQRTPEIAMRKINGATNADIFRRIVSEGLILLTLVTPIAIAIDWLICHNELNMNLQRFNYSTGMFAISVAITYLLLAIMIICGSFYPALKAMRIDPASALKDE
ncbi:MAG: FtsX-like permease family protein [Muribaculaceae bacterium]|nr:FtsX-like permease family protein [Muribaculaceae bacterium]